MPNNNDIYMTEFNALREEVVGIAIIERVYQMLKKFAGLDIYVVKVKINRLLESDKLTESERYFLVWALTNLNAGVSKQDFIDSLDGMDNIVKNRRELVESKLHELFTAMQIAGDEKQVALADGILNKMGETSLYDQMLGFDALLKKAEGEAPNGESFPGTAGRGQRG